MSSRNEDIHQDDGSDVDGSDVSSDEYVELVNEHVLGQVRRNNPKLTHLRITDLGSSNFIHEFDWKDAGDIFAANDQLKKLDIVSRESDMPNTFWRGVGRSRSINALAIGETDLIHNSAIDGMSDLFVNNGNLCQITFDRCDIWEEHVRLLATSLMKRHNTQSLKKIEISGCDIFNGEQAIGELMVALEGYNNLVKLSMDSSGFGGRTAYFALANMLRNPICKLDEVRLERSRIDDDCCAIFGAALSKNKSLVYLDISVTLMNIIGAKSIAACLRVNSTLTILDLSGCNFEDQGAAVLGDALANNSTLQTLNFNRNDSITSVGWRAFSACLESPNSALNDLSIYRCSIDNESVTALGNALANNSALKILDMAFNSANSVGWGAFSAFLRSPGLKLEHLDVQGDNCNDDTVVVFANALVGNTCLKFFDVGGNPLTSRSWDALSNLVCNKSSIEAIYTSNHTLHFVEYEGNPPNDLVVNLNMNRNHDKVEVARQKIIRYHFVNGKDHMEDSIAMEMGVIPHVISWIGKNDVGLSLLYKLFQSIPTLFDTVSNAKAAGVKRKRMGSDI